MHASDLLPLLDFDLLRQNPKIIMGSSDITVLLNAIHVQTGLVTFHGPALMTDWAEYPSMMAYSREGALAALTRKSPIGLLSAPSSWTEEFLDWETGEDERRPRQQRPNGGWRWIRPASATGDLVGGCLESLQHLRGTRWWPNLDGAILFLETSEESESPEAADAILGDYANMGVFDRIAGLLVSKPYGYDDAERERFEAYLEARTAPYSFPIVANMDFGHTSPQLTLPVGVKAMIDGDRGSVSIDSPAVS
jgi:muramoyltetrapeptide carboxypeptidase